MGGQVSAELDLAQELYALHEAEERPLKRLDRYTRGIQDSVYVPKSAKTEFKWLVHTSQMNVLGLIENALVQGLFIDGYRPEPVDGQLPADVQDSTAWSHWQYNRMDLRQSGLFRSAGRFGASYLLIEPGEPVPTWRPYSPLKCTAAYEEPAFDEWPVAALIESRGYKTLWTPETKTLFKEQEGSDKLEQVSEPTSHGLGVCPVVRFVNKFDVDGDPVGEIGPLIPLQDQLNFITFSMLMATQYAAFKQRWATGMAIPEDESGRPLEPFNAAVSRLWIADDPDTKFGEFSETDLAGYLSLREKTLQILATVAQLPPHQLGGAAVSNISAEALASLEVQRDRNIEEHKTSFGESAEQCFRLSALASGDTVGAEDTSAQVVWRATNAQSLAQTVDALGKEVQMLQVPIEMAWERIPGWTQQDVSRARDLQQGGDSLAALTAALTAQTAEVPVGFNG